VALKGLNTATTLRSVVGVYTSWGSELPHLDRRI
jgi:hypothetical protein